MTPPMTDTRSFFEVFEDTKRENAQLVRALICITHERDVLREELAKRGVTVKVVTTTVHR